MGKEKLALVWMPASGGWDGRRRVDFYPKSDPTSDDQWARAFTDRGRGLHVKTAQAALTVLLKLVISGLISAILIALNTVNLQFQGQFPPISLRPVLRTVMLCYAYSVVTTQLSSPI